MVKKIASKSSGNAITNFIRSEITAPEKRAGNTSIAISLTVFGLAVTFLRSLGDIKKRLEIVAMTGWISFFKEAPTQQSAMASPRIAPESPAWEHVPN
ncbi:hypothetical protein BGZ82_009010 [Podila clonocystis]|nr:hypothetical protein BGZ82_009010 [Podila clonocystis]